MSPLLQILAIYIATSLAAGLTLGVALGTMIRRAERRHRQHVAQLMRSRTCKPWLISRAHTSAAAPRTLHGGLRTLVEHLLYRWPVFCWVDPGQPKPILALGILWTCGDARYTGLYRA